MKSGRTSCTQYLAYARYEMIITELWMEPQSGSPVHSDHRHHHHDKTISKSTLLQTNPSHGTTQLLASWGSIRVIPPFQISGGY